MNLPRRRKYPLGRASLATLILFGIGLSQAGGLTNQAPASASADSGVATNIKHRLLWESEPVHLSEVTNQLSTLDENYNLFGVYVPSSTGRLDASNPTVLSLLKLGLPILEMRDDGSWGAPAAAGQEEGLQSYSLRTSHLKKTRDWMKHNKSAAPNLDLGVRIQENEEGFQVNRLEVGTAGNILWFMFDDSDADDPKSQVEIRLPF